MICNKKSQSNSFKFIILQFFFLLSFISFSQSKIISGVVNDTNGDPIIGVNIVQETQKNNGAVTDFDGNFTISINDDSRLIFSYIGFATKKIETKGRTSL
jgi:hypothetical protein